jgi:hypothetical protein
MAIEGKEDSERIVYKKCRLRDPREEHTLQLYTDDHYYNLNRFLSGRDTLDVYQQLFMYTYSSNFYHYITGSNNRQMDLPLFYSFHTLSDVKSHWDDLEWFQRMQYHFFMELYGIILRCPLQDRSSTVYRGVSSHYLKEDPSNAYHITTFLSTSPSKTQAIAFSSRGYLYKFTLAPDVPCLFVGGYEVELIINPYVLYTFIKKERDENSYEVFHYLLSASNVEPPAQFDEFIAFRDSIMSRAEPPIRGGGLESNIYNHRNITNSLSIRRKNRRNTGKYVNNRQNTKNTRKSTKRGATSHVSPELASLYRHGRMSSPIGTGDVAVPLSQEMKDMVLMIRNK